MSWKTEYNVLPGEGECPDCGTWALFVLSPKDEEADAPVFTICRECAYVGHSYQGKIRGRGVGEPPEPSGKRLTILGSACVKCGALSGDDWKQCEKSCPIPDSPHYDADWRPGTKSKAALQALRKEEEEHLASFESDRGIPF